MTHKYVFLRNPESVNPDSVVFFVRVGDSETERRNLRVINSYAAVMGAFRYRLIPGSLNWSARHLEVFGTYLFDSVPVQYHLVILSGS